MVVNISGSMLTQLRNRKCELVSGFLLLLFVAVLSSCSTVEKKMPLYIGRSAEVQNYDVRRNIAALDQRVLNAAKNQGAVVENYGDVSVAGQKYVLKRVVLQPEKTDNRILLIGGVHGNEPAGVEAVVRFLESDLSQFKNCHFEIYYLVNPWGWEHHLRFNSMGIDLNRDLLTSLSNEITFFLESLSTEKYDAVLDVHEASSSGYFLYQYGLNGSRLARRTADELKKSQIRLENEYKDFIFQADHGVLHVPSVILPLMHSARRFTVTNYFYWNRHGAVFTLESPKNGDFEERVQAHLAAIRFILGSL